MKIDFNKWRGELPRYQNSVIADDYARCAVNTKFWHGRLEPFACPTEICDEERLFDIKTLVPEAGCCLAFPETVDYVSEFCGLSFITGRAYPEVSNNPCDDSWCRLGVPCPPNAPSASSGGDCSQQTAQLMYRYVNKFGHVGPPSYLSNAVQIGGSGSLSGIVIPDPEWCITEVDVFMVTSGTKTGNEEVTGANTAAMFVGRHPIGGSVSISTLIRAAEDELDSADNVPPPANLIGIVATEFGLAGFEGKNVWYTKPNQPNAWPNKLCLDDEIRAIAYWNGNLIVMTDCKLYSFPEAKTEAGYEFTAPFMYANKTLPLIGGRKAVAVGQAGVFYPSTHGIVLANSRKALFISDSVFAKDDWCRINPESMIGVYSDYGYMFFNDTISYVLEVKDGTFESDQVNNYRLPFNVDAAAVDCEGNLNFADGDKWYVWDHCRCIKDTFECDDDGRCICCDCCPYHYESVEKRFEREERITDGVIVFDGTHGHVDLKVYDASCRDRLIFEGTFTVNTDDCGNIQCDRKYFVLDSCAMVQNVKIVLDGCASVRRVSLATARSSL